MCRPLAVQVRRGVVILKAAIVQCATLGMVDPPYLPLEAEGAQP